MPENLINKIIRSRRRTLALQIEPDATLIVRAPQRASLEIIQKIVREKLPWILKKQQQAREVYRPSVSKQFIDGEKFLYLGETYPLRIVQESSAPVIFDGKEFLFWEKYLSTAKNQFASWYKERAAVIIGERLKQYVDRDRFQYSRVRMSNAKTRWGSCSAKGTLNFNWRLIMAPMSIVDYVVAHELAHLIEHNHSARFWKKVRILFPNYKQAEDWLKKNQYLLTI